MVKSVRLPDGRQFDFPDEATPEQMTEAVNEVAKPVAKQNYTETDDAGGSVDLRFGSPQVTLEGSAQTESNLPVRKIERMGVAAAQSMFEVEKLLKERSNKRGLPQNVQRVGELDRALAETDATLKEIHSQDPSSVASIVGGAMESVIPSSVGLVATASGLGAVPATVAGLASNMALETAGAYNDRRQMGQTSDEAMPGAVAEGGVSTALEMGPLYWVNKLLKGQAKNVWSSVGKIGLGEFGQEAGTQGFSDVLRNAEGLQDLSAGEMVGRAAQAGAQGMVMVPLMAPFGKMIHYGKLNAMAKAQDQALVDTVMKAAGEEANPELEQAARQIAAELRVETVGSPMQQLLGMVNKDNPTQLTPIKELSPEEQALAEEARQRSQTRIDAPTTEDGTALAVGLSNRQEGMRQSALADIGAPSPAVQDRIDRVNAIPSDPESASARVVIRSTDDRVQGLEIGQLPNLPAGSVVAVADRGFDLQYHYPQDIVDATVKSLKKFIDTYAPSMRIVLDLQALGAYGMGQGNTTRIADSNKNPVYVITPRDLPSYKVEYQGGNTTSRMEYLGVLFHEFGHALKMHGFHSGMLTKGVAPELANAVMADLATGNITPETVQALGAVAGTEAGLIAQWADLRARVLDNTMSAKEFVDTWIGGRKVAWGMTATAPKERPPYAWADDKLARLGKTTIGATALELVNAYGPAEEILSFDEFFAEQISRAMSDSKVVAQSALGQIFKPIVDMLRKVFVDLKKEGIIKPGTTIQQWLDEQTAFAKVQKKTKGRFTKSKALEKALAAPRVDLETYDPEANIEELPKKALEDEAADLDEEALAFDAIQDAVASGLIEEASRDYKILTSNLNRGKLQEVKEKLEDLGATSWDREYTSKLMKSLPQKGRVSVNWLTRRYMDNGDLALARPDQEIIRYALAAARQGKTTGIPMWMLQDMFTAKVIPLEVDEMLDGEWRKISNFAGPYIRKWGWEQLELPTRTAKALILRAPHQFINQTHVVEDNVWAWVRYNMISDDIALVGEIQSDLFTNAVGKFGERVSYPHGQKLTQRTGVVMKTPDTRRIGEPFETEDQRVYEESAKESKDIIRALTDLKTLLVGQTDYLSPFDIDRILDALYTPRINVLKEAGKEINLEFSRGSLIRDYVKWRPYLLQQVDLQLQDATRAWASDMDLQRDTSWVRPQLEDERKYRGELLWPHRVIQEALVHFREQGIKYVGFIKPADAVVMQGVEAKPLAATGLTNLYTNIQEYLAANYETTQAGYGNAVWTLVDTAQQSDIITAWDRENPATSTTQGVNAGLKNILSRSTAKGNYTHAKFLDHFSQLHYRAVAPLADGTQNHAARDMVKTAGKVAAYRNLLQVGGERFVKKLDMVDRQTVDKLSALLMDEWKSGVISVQLVPLSSTRTLNGFERNVMAEEVPIEPGWKERVFGWEYRANASTVALFKKAGIENNSEQGQELLELFLEYKNLILDHFVALEAAVQKKLGTRYKDSPLVLMNELQKLDEVMSKLRGTPFVPQVRYGNFVITVMKKERGNKYKVVSREHFDDVGMYQEKLKRLQRMAKANPTMYVKGEEQSDYMGIPLQLPKNLLKDIQSTGEFNEDQIDILEELMQPAGYNKIAQRYNSLNGELPGASTDLVKNFAHFIWHNSNFIWKLKFKGEFQKSLNAQQAEIRRNWKRKDMDPDVQVKVGGQLERNLKLMQGVRDYVLYPPAEFQGLKLAVTLGYLAYVPKTALMNISSMLNTMAYLVSEYGEVKATKHWFQGIYDAARLLGLEAKLKSGQQLSAHDQELFVVYDWAVRDGVIDQSYAYALAGVATSSDFTYQQQRVVKLPGFIEKRVRIGAIARLAIDLGMSMFRTVEHMNRAMTLVMNYNAARESGVPMEDAYARAVERTNQMQNDFGAASRAPILRGKKSLLMVFMSYPIFMNHVMVGGGLSKGIEKDIGGYKSLLSKAGIGPRALLWAIYLALGGALGLPYAENIKDFIQWLWRSVFGRTENLDLVLRDFASAITDNPDLILRGLTKDIGGMDLSRSFGLGHIIPLTDLINRNWDNVEEALGKGTVQAAGPFGGFSDSMMRMIGAGIGAVDGRKRFEEVMKEAPGVVGNVGKAIDAWHRQTLNPGMGIVTKSGVPMTTDPVTGEPRDLTPAELIKLGMGAQPSLVTRNREMFYLTQGEQIYWQAQHNKLLSERNRALMEGDEGKVTSINSAIERFNSKIENTDYAAFRITGKDMARSFKAYKRRVRDMIVQGAPSKAGRGIAGQVRESYQDQ